MSEFKKQAEAIDICCGRHDLCGRLALHPFCVTR
jgi:hypothetical protein